METAAAAHHQAAESSLHEGTTLHCCSFKKDLLLPMQKNGEKESHYTHTQDMYALFPPTTNMDPAVAPSSIQKLKQATPLSLRHGHNVTTSKRRLGSASSAAWSGVSLYYGKVQGGIGEGWRTPHHNAQ
jgi:hypothetical protein